MYTSSRREAKRSIATSAKSARRGKRGSAVEVTNVSAHGFWLFLDDREVLVAFDRFPWFLEATIRALTNVERPHPSHLRWPALDVDLEVESIEHPDRYPLVSHVPEPAVSEPGRRLRGRQSGRPRQG